MIYLEGVRMFGGGMLTKRSLRKKAAHEKLGVKMVSIKTGVGRMQEGVMFCGTSDVRSDSGRKTKVTMTDRNPGKSTGLGPLLFL